MIWCRFEMDGRSGWGLVCGGTVEVVEGSPFSDWSGTGRYSSLDAVRLLPPVEGGNIYALGSNYRSHIVARSAARGKPPRFPAEPTILHRTNAALVGHNDSIQRPDVEHFEYEGELALIIGRPGYAIPLDRALEHVFGWTIANDVTARDWQSRDQTSWRAKNSDTFNPMGPWIATDADPARMQTRVHLNGSVVEDFETADMIFTPAEVIAFISRHVTLHAGDAIWLGTDGEPRNMNVGDRVEVEISGIGTLGNEIVRRRNEG